MRRTAGWHERRRLARHLFYERSHQRGDAQPGRASLRSEAVFSPEGDERHHQQCGRLARCRFKNAAEQATAGMLAELPQETAKAEAASRTAVRAAWTAGVIGAGALSLVIGYGLAALQVRCRLPSLRGAALD